MTFGHYLNHFWINFTWEPKFSHNAFETERKNSVHGFQPGSLRNSYWSRLSEWQSCRYFLSELGSDRFYDYSSQTTRRYPSGFILDSGAPAMKSYSITLWFSVTIDNLATIFLYGKCTLRWISSLLFIKVLLSGIGQLRYLARSRPTYF